MTFGEQANPVFCGGKEWGGGSKVDQLDMGQAGQHEIVRFDVTGWVDMWILGWEGWRCTHRWTYPWS
jgi:hypothetical protein